MLKHGAITQSRVADAETQRKPLRTNGAETRGSRHSQRSGRHSQSAIHVAETARELRC
jgi:hypothetical protein